jgi:hypothetical protein
LPHLSLFTLFIINFGGEHGNNLDSVQVAPEGKTDPFHKDIYYLDGLETESFLQLYDQYKELLINDGFINYGYGSHKSTDEVFVGPYKLFTIYTNEMEKYIDTLIELSIPRIEVLINVWDNVSIDTPVSRMSVKYNEKDIYNMIVELSKTGLYFAQRQEDY